MLRTSSSDVLAPGESPGAGVLISRRRWLSAAGVGLCATSFGCDSDPPPPPKPGVAWLAARQAHDGGWHSANYAQLRGGAALTPLVVLATKGNLPANAQPRALEFIRRSVSDHGIVGAADPELLDYPNYATALALEPLIAADDPHDKPLIERM